MDPYELRLFQGDSWSPLLAGLLQRIWGHRVSIEVPLVRRSAFVDDRQYWKTGERAAQALGQALSTAKKVDKALGWTTNDKKFELAASTPEGRQQLRDIFAKPAGTTVTTLGLIHDLEEPTNLTFKQEQLDEALRRAQRIRLASRTLQHRMCLLTSLVSSLFLWAAPAIPAPLASLQKIRSAMLRAYYGFLPKAASITLAFAAAPANIDIAVAWDIRFVSYMLLLCRRPLSQHKWYQTLPDDFASASIWSLTPACADFLDRHHFTIAPRRPDVLMWRDTNDTARSFRLLHDSVPTFRHFFENRRNQLAINKEPRIFKNNHHRNDPDNLLATGLNLAPPPRPIEVDFERHRRRLHPPADLQLETRKACKHLALGAGPSAFRRKPAQKAEKRNIPCLCGRLDPSAAHLLWNCPATPPPETTPTDRLQERLFLATCPPVPAPPHTRDLQRIPAELQRLINDSRSHGVITISTDGGTGYDLAAWAVTADSGHTTDVNYRTSAGILAGEDQGGWAAEIAAISLALRSIIARGTADIHTVVWVYDSKAAAKVILSGTSTGHTTAEALAAQSARAELESRGIDFHAIWISSHNKAMPNSWSPPPGITEETLRILNDKADRACTATLRRFAEATGRSTTAEQRKQSNAFADAAFLRCQEVLALWAPHLQTLHPPPESAPVAPASAPDQDA